MSKTVSKTLCSEIEVVAHERVPDWDGFVGGHPRGTIFHTLAMIEAYRATPDYETLAIAARSITGELIGLLVANKISTVGAWAGNLAARSVLFAEPLVVQGEIGRAALGTLLGEHDRLMRDQVVFAEVRPMHACSSCQPEFATLGYEHFNYDNYEMNLTSSPDEIFKTLNSKRRNNIRANERRGLTVRTGCPRNDVRAFYDQLVQSYSRSKIPLVDRRHFESVFEKLSDSQCRLAFADLNGQPIASACHLAFNGRVYCWFAGTHRVPGIAAQVSLVWDGMKWGAANGQTIYDFAGGGWEGEHYGPGVFKSRFGAQHVNVGRYRKVYSKWRMKVAEAGYQLARPLFSHQTRS